MAVFGGHGTFRLQNQTIHFSPKLFQQREELRAEALAGKYRRQSVV